MTTTVVVVLGALCGGFVTGLTGFGTGLTALAFWLRGWNADAQRAVYQPFNLIILAIVLCTYITQGIMTEPVGGLVLVCIPATILGAYLGIRTYGRVNDQQFRAMVLWLLLISGIVLTVSNLP